MKTHGAERLINLPSAHASLCVLVAFREYVPPIYSAQFTNNGMFYLEHEPNWRDVPEYLNASLHWAEWEYKLTAGRQTI